MKNLKTKKSITWTLLLVAAVLILGYTQLGWFGGNVTTTEPDTNWLMVLHSSEAKITEIRGETFLTLSKISSDIIFFSDRPERKYQSIDTDEFIAEWDIFFADFPPNAAMVHAEAGVDTDIVIIELFSPIITANEISFPIEIIGGDYTEGEVYKDVNLFVDFVCIGNWCWGSRGY